MQITQQLNSSTAQQLSSSAAAVLLLVTVGLAGCETRPRPPLVQATAAGQSAGAKSIQAGIVLSDRPGYMCFSFSDIGLTEEARVENLQSSCECVKPSLIQYLAADQQSRTGVLLEFVPEAPDPAVVPGVDAEVRATRLAVNVDLKLADGQTHRFTVHLLHSVPAAMEDS